jgi:hypothetical protein
MAQAFRAEERVPELKTLITTRDKVRGLAPSEVFAEVLLRTRRRAARAFRRALDRRGSTHLTNSDLEHALRHPMERVADRIRFGERPHLTPGLAEPARTSEAVRETFADSAERITASAEAIIQHRVVLYNREFNLGPRIDWQTDPFSGVRWPQDHFSRIPIRLKPGADVRVVWELNRLQHLTTLGQAYALTGDERYTEEFLLQLTSWNHGNPPRFGPNWMVAMEAGIRAVSLLSALELFRSSRLLTNEALALILKILIAHGRFIRTNLEFSYRRTSNHYLSNLIALFALGVTLPDLKESEDWAAFSRQQLLEEMNKQVLPDGVDWEGTIGYHRFVVEIFALFFSLCRATGNEMPLEHRERLEAMFDFVRCYLKPDGTAPSIGDSDDGRLLKFKERPANDHSYLMSIAAVLFDDNRFKQGQSVDEEAVWWFGGESVQRFADMANGPQPISRGFDDSQIYVQREGPLYAIIDCGDHGTRGHGSHAHSDALSIELFAFDRTFLCDPGTFVYTGDESQRDLFRSTAYHNTVRIDDRDISLIREGELFSLGPNVRPRILRWTTDRDRDVLDASHAAYANLGHPVVHRREITFEKAAGYWVLQDSFIGDGEHKIEFFFNFDAGIELSLHDGNRVVARAASCGLAIVPSREDLELEVAERWVSPAYGTRHISSAIIFRLQTEIPFSCRTLLIPYRAGDEGKLKRVLGQKQERA